MTADFFPLTGFNVAFVSSESFTGNLGGLTGADGQCQRLASAANLAGTYRAWLSSSTENAIDRFAGARAWVLPDGSQFADSLGDLTSGRLLAAIHIDENGGTVDEARVWTTTLADGTRSTTNTCVDWTSAGVSVFAGTEGLSSGGPLSWTSLSGPGLVSNMSCMTPKRIYCLGTAANPPLPLSGFTGVKLAFVSNGTVMPSAGGVTALDNRCVLEASMAGYSGTFKALVATTTAPASNRLDFAATYLGTGIAGTGAEIAAGRLRSGLWRSPNNVFQGQSNEETWTGAPNLGDMGTAEGTCSDWTSTAGTQAITGVINRVGVSWWTGGAVVGASRACNRALRVFCVQQ